MQQNVTFKQAQVAYLFFLCILCDEWIVIHLTKINFQPFISTDQSV